MTKIESEIFLSKIRKVLDTQQLWEDKSLHYPPAQLIELILSIEGVAKDVVNDFSTNGWEYDWFQYFIYQDDQYILSGSGYYGGHTFGLA